MDAFDLLTFGATLGSGLVAGFFFAFSVCVMRALERIPASQGIAAMQSINLVVINPWFLSVFFGTAALCVALIAGASSRWQDPRAVYWLAGSALYVLGTILVTIRFNVPRNNALASLSPTSPEAGAYWRDYLSNWTRWNHVRTIAALLAAMLLTYALTLRS